MFSIIRLLQQYDANSSYAGIRDDDEWQRHVGLAQDWLRSQTSFKRVKGSLLFPSTSKRDVLLEEIRQGSCQKTVVFDVVPEVPRCPEELPNSFHVAR